VSIPIAKWSGTFTLFGVVLHCHVLSDGRPIIEADDVEALFAAMGEPGSTVDTAELERFARWQRGEAQTSQDDTTRKAVITMDTPRPDDKPADPKPEE